MRDSVLTADLLLTILPFLAYLNATFKYIGIYQYLRLLMACCFLKGLFQFSHSPVTVNKRNKPPRSNCPAPFLTAVPVSSLVWQPGGEEACCSRCKFLINFRDVGHPEAAWTCSVKFLGLFLSCFRLWGTVCTVWPEEGLGSSETTD